MAALTATSMVKGTAGHQYITYAQLPAASNGDTWDASASGITAITFAQTVPNDTSTVAADSVSATWSGSTVTFAVAGTARAQAVTVWGRGPSGR